MNLDMEDVVAAAQNGCREAQDDLMRRCWPIAKRIAQRVWNDKPSGGKPRPSADFDDRVQEALIAIWRQALPKYDKRHKSRASFETTAWWWASSGARLWTKKRRRYDKRVRSDTAQVMEPLDYMREQLRQQLDSSRREFEEREDLYSKLRQLPIEDQRMLFYRFWMDLNVREIEQLSREPQYGLRKMSRQTVLNVQNRALARIRELLEE